MTPFAPLKNFAGPGTGNFALAIYIIVLVNFVANFLFLEGFGFYEDDYLFTLPALNWSWSDYVNQIVDALKTWPQGRPFGWVLLHTFSYVVGLAHNLQAYHVFSYLLSSLAGVFLYVNLRKLAPGFGALAGTIFYVLYPADAGKQIFMHQSLFPLGTILCLIALRAYTSRAYGWFILLAITILLTYEPYFLILFAAPLLVQNTGIRRRLRTLLLNGMALVAILFLVLITRSYLGDERATNVIGSGSEYLFRIATAPAIGLWTALQLAVTRPLEALLFNSYWGYVFLALSVGAFILSLKTLAAKTDRGAAPPNLLPPIQLLLAGLAMAAAAYFYRFYPDYYPPVINIGRLSSLHGVSAVGAAFVFSGLVAYIGSKWERPTVWILSLYFSLLVSFGLEIQASQYVRNWDLQKVFFSQVIALTADARAGEPILVNIDTGFGSIEPFESRPATEGFPPFWLVNYTYDILDKLVAYPEEWSTPPRLFGYWGGAVCTALEDGVRVRTPPWFAPRQQPILRDNDFILLEWVGGELIRQTSSMAVCGTHLTPRAPDPALVHLQAPGPLHGLFYERSISHPLWKTILPNMNYPPR